MLRESPSVCEYQRSPEVQERIREFCGWVSDPRAGAVYVSSMGPEDGSHATWGHVPPRPPEHLGEILAAGRDLTRSMWDRRSLLIYVDLDYLRADVPGDAYLHPADAFLKLEPTYRAVRDTLRELGIPALDLMTGAGYGFVSRVLLGGVAAARLAALAPGIPPWYATHPERRPAWTDAALGADEARAYHGLGLVLELVAHRVLARAAPQSDVPVVVNNTEVGAGGIGRECVSIDLTHLGDPLDVRHVRTAFGVYQKHRLRPDVFGDAAARRPAIVVVPRAGRDLVEMLTRRRDVHGARKDARVLAAEIPDAEAGVRRLVEAYTASPLARWHREYYALAPHPAADWPSTYRTLDLATLPACVAACLRWPNDLLLKPAHLQLLVRTLLARGWPPRHVAGLVHMHYTAPGLWNDHWTRVDPATRADFDVRVFAALVAMGLDEGVDFNCVSTQEKGLCPRAHCAGNLALDRERLLARRRV